MRPVRPKLFVDDGDFRVVAEAFLVPDASTGRLTLTEYGEYVGETVRTIAGSAGDLARRWSHSPTRNEVIGLLSERNITLPDLSSLDGLEVCDPLDLLLNLAWNLPARTRAERARRARDRHSVEIAAMSETAQAVLGSLLEPLCGERS